ncbi:hypothetical protein FYK55_17790 [Roseiconus nitratireducens]|uniref:RanBP2-type domain-containing protein n=1 Tax=Roseiconus nitratireducens TaxID=2605748 RepID=A0A5M6D1M6_9BACT|nr:DUF2007 domain-containing protein [Roseiconus nitratireducens]KAA5541417.1 hypothetical protein FYK55_17790 [Roseiconus nitratireducens]
MSDALRVVQRCGDQWSGYTIRNLLLDDGIDAIVSGTDAATALGMGGAPTNSLIQVKVREEDYARAIELIERYQSEPRSEKRWQCARCDEINEGNFDYCWNCQADRATSGRDVTSDSVAQGSIEFDGDPFASPEAVPTESGVASSRNPYHPVLIHSSSEDDKSTPARLSLRSEQEEEAELRYRIAVRRAVLAAIATVFIFPPVLSWFPVVLWLRLPPRPDFVAPPRWQFWVLLAFTGLGIGWGMWIWSQTVLWTWL